MSTFTASEQFTLRIRTMRSVLAAIAAGAVLFAIIAFFVRKSGAFGPAPDPPILT